MDVKWQYYRWFTDMKVIGVDEKLDELGAEGWELVSVLPQAQMGVYYIFKRVIKKKQLHR